MVSAMRFTSISFPIEMPMLLMPLWTSLGVLLGFMRISSLWQETPGDVLKIPGLFAQILHPNFDRNPQPIMAGQYFFKDKI